MILTTWARVSFVCPIAALITNEDIQDMILEDVARSVLEDVYGERTEEAQRYLAGHLAMFCVPSSSGGLGSGVVGAIASESIGGVSISYGDATAGLMDKSRYDETPCGRRFKQIQREAGIGHGPIWIV